MYGPQTVTAGFVGALDFTESNLQVLGPVVIDEIRALLFYLRYLVFIYIQ